MHGFLIWGAFTVGVGAFCVLGPHPARIFVGLFGAMGLGIHGALIATKPRSHVDFAADALWAISRDIGTSLNQEFPTDVWAMLRRHRRPQLMTAARRAAARAHATGAQVTTIPPRWDLGRSTVTTAPHPEQNSMDARGVTPHLFAVTEAR